MHGKVYDVHKCELINGPNVLDPFISCAEFHRYDFDSLPKPTNVIKVVRALWGKPWLLFCVEVANLWHDVCRSGSGTRKDRRALYIYGKPNSYRTYFMDKLLSAGFQTVLIHRRDGQLSAWDCSDGRPNLLIGEFAVQMVFLEDAPSSGKSWKNFLSRYTSSIETLANTQLRGGGASIETKIHDLEPAELTAFLVWCNSMVYFTRRGKTPRVPQSWYPRVPQSWYEKKSLSWYTEYVKP